MAEIKKPATNGGANSTTKKTTTPTSKPRTATVSKPQVEEAKIEKVENQETKSYSDLEKAFADFKAESQKKDEQIAKLLELLAKGNVQEPTVQKTPEDLDREEIVIGCHAFTTTALATLGEDICVLFECGEEKPLTYGELKQIFKENHYKNNKKLFENDIFYFTDKANYKRFGINKKVDISKEEILNILLEKDENVMIDKVNKLTENLTNGNVIHAFQYQIALMLADEKNPLALWTWKNRDALERRLGRKFDELIANSGVYKYFRENMK